MNDQPDGTEGKHYGVRQDLFPRPDNYQHRACFGQVVRHSMRATSGGRLTDQAGFHLLQLQQKSITNDMMAPHPDFIALEYRLCEYEPPTEGGLFTDCGVREESDLERARRHLQEEINKKP
jgi:hypothetical protein